MNKFNTIMTAIGASSFAATIGLIYNTNQQLKSDDFNKRADRDLKFRRLELEENKFELEKFKLNLSSKFDTDSNIGQIIKKEDYPISSHLADKLNNTTDVKSSSDIINSSSDVINSALEPNLMDTVPSGIYQLISIAYGSFGLIILIGLITLLLNEYQLSVVNKHFDKFPKFLQNGVNYYYKYVKVYNKLVFLWMFVSVIMILLLSLYLFYSNLFVY